MRLRLSQIAQIIGVGRPDADPEVAEISIDSRKTGPGSLFCAIEGENADGHDFINAAADMGAVAALATKRVASKIPLLVIESVPEALSKVAKSIRNRFEGPVVGITGSIGKTSTKELLSAALGGETTVLKTEGNLNTEYGVPMTWMKLEPKHKYAVIEMGMRGVGQIRHLCSICRPHVGIVTMVGSAHMQMLGSREAIMLAKGELLESLPESGCAIIPSDPTHLPLRNFTKAQILTFGTETDATVRIISWNCSVEDNRTECEFEVSGERFRGTVPALGRHQARNGAAALAACVALGFPLDLALEGIGSASMPNDRLRAAKMRGAIVLVDVYNSSPESCKEALSVLGLAPRVGRRIAILGDMLELGSPSPELHRSVGAEAARVGVDSLYCVGEMAELTLAGAVEAGFTGESKPLSDIDEVEKVLASIKSGDVVLIKGSRKLRLEDALRRAGVPGV